MDDKPKRRVTGQISIASSTNHATPSSSTSSAPRVRARVNPANISSSPTPSSTPPSRPSVRSTPSSSSLRSHITSASASTPVSRTRSPAPPRSTVGTPSSPHVTPVARARVAQPTSGSGGANHATPTTAATPRIRASVSVSEVGTSHPPPNLHRGESEPARPPSGTVRARVRAMSRSDAPPPLTSSTNSTHSVLSTHSLHTSQSPRNPPTPHSAPSHASVHPSPLLSPSSMMTSVRPPTPPSSAAAYSRGLALSGDVGFPQHFSSIIAGELTSSPQTEPEPSSNHSSPVRPLRPLDMSAHTQLAAVLAQQSTASAPPTPAPASAWFPNANGDANPDRKKQRPQLPWNPHHPPPPLPQPPTSPELRTVALPTLTPTFSRTSASASVSAGMLSGSGSDGASLRRTSASESEMSAYSQAMAPALMHAAQQEGGRHERDRLSGSTAVDDGEEHMGKGENDVDVMLHGDARQAKIDRKIADLEISNASLLAINRSLEATKAKQRSEILKLRRQLRESLQGGPLPLTSPRTELESPGLNLSTPPISSLFSDQFIDDVMEDDPELEARWDRLADLVTNMCRRGTDAVERVNQEEKVGGQRVLGWLEVEEMQELQARENGTGGSGVVSGDVSLDASRGVSPRPSPRPSLGAEEEEREKVEGMLMDEL